MPSLAASTSEFSEKVRSVMNRLIVNPIPASHLPATSFINPGAFLERSRYVLDRFEQAGEKGQNVLSNEERQTALHALNHVAYKLEPPLHELEHALHPWVVFAVMPIFALANAGVPLGGGLAEALTSPVTLGIVSGLVVGKQLGITLFAWLAVRSGVAELPEEIGWRHVYGAVVRARSTPAMVAWTPESRKQSHSPAPSPA